jgi:hypothetical protein
VTDQSGNSRAATARRTRSSGSGPRREEPEKSQINGLRELSLGKRAAERRINAIER